MELSEERAQTPNGDATGATVGADDGDASGNRRKSGRVVKKPEAYVPGASQVPNGSQGKRKRVNGTEGDGGAVQDASQESASSSDDDGEDDAHEEELRERKRRLTAAKKAQAAPAAGGVKRTKARGAGKGLAFRGKRARGGQAMAGESTESLYDQVFFGEDTVEAAAEAWLSRYQNENVPAMRELVNFVLRLTGCSLDVTVDDIEDQDNVTGKLSDLQDEYQAQKIVEYPLIAKARNAPPVRANIASFFRSVMDSAHASGILYEDKALLENIELWITTMSSSAIRPFRHTATVIAVEIVNALCDLSVEIADADAKTMRQLETEKKKARGNKARTEALETKIGEGEQNRATLEGTIKDVFDTVFVHRYRDVDPRIRADCIQGLGYWIFKLPDIFFEGTYLRYLGWVLSDTAAPTRLEVVKQLQRLFKNRENVGGMRSFTDRFRSRLVEMAARDAELSVRTQTVELLDLIREAGLLEPDDIDTIGRLIFDSDLRLRKAVVGFFAQNINDLYESKIEDLGGEEAMNETLARKNDEDYDKPRVAWLKLKCLVELLQSYDTEDEDPSHQIERGSGGANDILIAAGVESRFSLAAQALYEGIPEIKQWEILAGYLLFDHSEVVSRSAKKKVDVETSLKKECRLDEKEEIILLKVLNTAVMLSLTQLHDSDTTVKGKKKKVLKVGPLEDQEELARHLSQLIPRLLKKFGAVPEAASTVLRLEHVLDLDVFHQLRQDSTTYSALLDDINKQFLTHGDQAVLVEASAALLHARGFEDLEEVTGEKVQSLWEDTINTLQAILKGKKLGRRASASLNVVTSLSNTIRRLGSLASISDCTESLEQPAASLGKKRKDDHDNLPPVDMLLGLLERGAGGVEEEAPAIHELEDGLFSSTMKVILFYFMWKVRSLQENLANGDEVPDEEIERLDDRKGQFAVHLAAAAEHRTGIDGLRSGAMGTFLDLYTLFATLRQPQRLATDVTADTDPSVRVAKLVTEVSPEHQVLLNSVFAGIEKAYAKKSRKTLEAGDEDAPVDDASDDESDEEHEAEDAESHGQATSLSYEQTLCELTGKIVLAIIARVLDASGPHAGKTKARLNKNRSRLGQNYKEVVAYLDGPKAKKGKKKATVSAAASAAATTSDERAANQKSDRVVVEEDDGEADEGDDIEDVPEGDEEDLRARELLENDIDMDDALDGEDAEDGHADDAADDEILIGD